MINYLNNINKGQKIGEIISIVFLCAVIPFLYTDYTIDPVLHPRFVAWSIFLIGSIIILLVGGGFGAPILGFISAITRYIGSR